MIADDPGRGMSAPARTVGPRYAPWTDAHKLARDPIARLLHRARPYLRGCVLDVGCGMKPYRSLLVQQSGWWVGVDYPTSASGKTRADVYGSALSLPFSDARFDSVLCTQVAEHVPSPEKLFAEIARVLRPGGTLILTTPQTEELHEQPHDYFRYTRYGLQHLAQANGLSMIEILPFGGAVQALALLAARELPNARAIPPLYLCTRLLVAALNLAGVVLDRLWLGLADRRTITVGHLLLARKS